MTLYLRVRRARLVAAVLAAAVAAVALVGSSPVPMPDLLAGALASFPAGVFIPLAPAFAVLAGLAEAAMLERCATRPVLGFDALLAGGCALAGAMLLVALDAAHVQAMGAEAGRNLAGYVGLALIGRYFVGERAATVFPLAAALAAALFGRGYGGIAAWAWPLAPGGSAVAAGQAGLLLAVGCGLSLFDRPPGRETRD